MKNSSTATAIESFENKNGGVTHHVDWAKKEHFGHDARALTPGYS